MTQALGTAWGGVALRRQRIGSDPDAPPRAVAIPAGWDDGAAMALAALVPGTGPVSLPRAAETWIRRAAAADPDPAGLAAALRDLLLRRRGAPGIEAWRLPALPGAAPPRFVLNLAGFLDPAGGVDLDGFAAACAVAVRALDGLAAERALRLRLGVADLAGLLAGLGLPYASAEARAVAAGLVALARGAAMAESGRIAARSGALAPLVLGGPAPPAVTALPGLAEAARAALDAAAAAPGLRHAALLALAEADATEALLGAEAAGIAPLPGPTRPVLTEAGELVDQPLLALRRAEAFPDGAALLAPVDAAARQAMQDAVAPFLHLPPPAPVALPAAPRALPQVAPPRRAAMVATHHAAIGGLRIALRTATDAAGRLGEIAFMVGRDGAPQRHLLEAVAQAVTLGLRAGAPLQGFVDAYAYQPGTPAGVVEGDPDIARATSVLDWAFRRLARDWLGRSDLPDPPADAPVAAAPAAAPLLPLDLPRQAPVAVARGRRRTLKLVGKLVG